MISIRERYEQFFRLGGPPTSKHRPWKYRRQCTSLRLEGCELLASIIEQRRPCSVLDLGSGLSSHVIRSIPDVSAVTTDLSEYWLDMTVRELSRDGLDTAHCYTQDQFDQLEQKPLAPYDVVSVDFGSTMYRVSRAADIVDWCAPLGIIVLDDFGPVHQTYSDAMTIALSQLGFRVIDRSEHIDEYGTFMATAERI